MTVESRSIQNICDEVSQEIGQLYEGLSLFFIVHSKGKFREAAAVAVHDISGHRAAKAGRAIIQKNVGSDRSKFLGLAINRESKMMGFKTIDHVLGIFTLNVDHFEHLEEARSHIYHLVWHAIDLYEIRQNPRYKNQFKEGPMVPKRSALNLSKANLQADIFGAILMALRDKTGSKPEELMKVLSKSRAVMSLLPIHGYKAEDYPSVIATEACTIVVKDLIESKDEIESDILTARNMSLDVGRAFDEKSIQQWWDFSFPAQDMAWRGHTPDEILGAASSVSENPFVRSMAYLVEEVTDIKPANPELLEHKYNAFVDPEINAQAHREMVDTIFEEAVIQGAVDSSNQPLLEAANKQNEELTEGRIIGWCANALQDAARAFEKALTSGTSPEQAARMQFEGNKHIPKWDELKELGKKIVDQRRQGFAVTMGHVAEICHDNPAFAPILDSIKLTMNDPSYIQKLDIANDFALSPSSPSPEASPKAPEPKGPAPTVTTPAPVAAPGLGGNNRASQLLRQKQLAAQREKRVPEDHTEE